MNWYPKSCIPSKSKMKMNSKSIPASEDIEGIVARMVVMMFRSCGHDRASLKTRNNRPVRSALSIPPPSPVVLVMISSTTDTITTTPSKMLNLSATYPRGVKPTSFTAISSAKYEVMT